ncbi:MAG: hypothetical protein AAF716_19525 [Cyanobacteria bacterium P01_D01_bin.1]
MNVTDKQADTGISKRFPKNSFHRRGITVVLLTLFGVSLSLPVLAHQSRQNVRERISTNLLESDALAIHSPKNSPKLDRLSSVDSSNTDSSNTDFGRSIDQFIAAETSHLSHAEQQALQALIQLQLEDDTLAALSSLSDSDFQAQLKSDQKFSKLPADIASLKFSPAVFAAARLAGHMRNIGKAALLGNVVGAIRAAEFDFPAMFSALSSGDTEEFSGLLSEALPRHNTFVEAISTGATFACNTATIDLTPNVCSRFSSFMRGTIARHQQSSKR